MRAVDNLPQPFGQMSPSMLSRRLLHRLIVAKNCAACALIIREENHGNSGGVQGQGLSSDDL
jgi:hypothetical protein